METQTTQDYIIPDEDSIFSLLPDGQEVTFPDLGGLRNHVQEEIAAWTNVENTIAGRYKTVLSKLEAVTKEAKEGRIEPGALSDVKKLLQEWAVNANGINSCVDSQSRLGRYISELRQQKLSQQVFLEYCLITIRVLGYPYKAVTFTSNPITLACQAARVAKYFACPEDLTEKIDDYKRRIKELTDAVEEIDRDYKLRKSQFEEKLSAAEYRMAALEEAYSKKLQLEGPAQHWKNLSRFYLGWGWGLLALSLVLGGGAIAALIWLLVQADTIVIFNEDKLSLSTIRASLILIAATSMAGYLLHLFTKLAISCFHLSRDYRERFQLTNVFLAFWRDGDVKCDDQVKQIVMQALFSRSDTGLLKGEHSFKMPGVADLMRKED